MLKLDQAVIVEGKYDQIRLSSLIDAPIIAVGGFRIYRDRETLALIKAFAQTTGVVILTDSDAAGFQIRSYLKSVLRGCRVTHVYVPDVYGKEKRKDKPSAEGKLGVEGLSSAVLEEAFARAGLNGAPEPRSGRPITKADLYEDGICGRENSAERRRALLAQMGLPAHLSANGLLTYLNTVMDYDRYRQEIERLAQR